MFLRLKPVRILNIALNDCKFHVLHKIIDGSDRNGKQDFYYMQHLP